VNISDIKSGINCDNTIGYGRKKNFNNGDYCKAIVKEAKLETVSKEAS
jgi:hypothetical protein